MSSSAEFVTYVCEQFQGAGIITSKKMFGEYGVYCNGKFFACICDDQLLVKITPPGERLLPNAEKAYPYEGATQLYFLMTDTENRDLLCALAAATWDALPAPKPKKPRQKQEEIIQG